MFRSEPGKYSIFNWSQNFIQLDFIPTAMASFVGKLYVFGKNQMAIINPETLVIEENIAGIGCLGPKALKTTSSGLFWLDYNNFYQSSPKIEKIGTTIKKQPQCGWDMITNAEKDLAVVGYDAVRQCVLFFFHKTDSSGTDKRCWSYYLPQRRWDLWETPKSPKDMAIDKDGDVMISGLQSISKYAVDSNNKRQWEWISKQITLGEDNKSKKYYKVETHSNTDEEFIQYSIDKGDFIQGSNISKKAKSLQIKIDSEDPNLEVDSISIPYRNLPNSKQNI